MSLQNEGASVDCMNSDDLRSFGNGHGSDQLNDNSRSNKRKDNDSEDGMTSSAEDDQHANINTNAFKRTKYLSSTDEECNNSDSGSEVEIETPVTISKCGFDCEFMGFMNHYEKDMDKENRKDPPRPVVIPSGSAGPRPRILPRERKPSPSNEIESGTYVTGATILAMKGIISFEDYNTHNYSQDIPQEILDRKFYLKDVIGMVRGMTKCKLLKYNDWVPSVPMLRRLREQEEERLENAVASDSEDSEDDSTGDEGENSENPRSREKVKPRKLTSTNYPTKLRPRFPRGQNQNNGNNENAGGQEIEVESGENSHTQENNDPGTGLTEELKNCGSCRTAFPCKQHVEELTNSKKCNMFFR